VTDFKLEIAWKSAPESILTPLEAAANSGAATFAHQQSPCFGLLFLGAYVSKAVARAQGLSI
jgi:hypothetical protein